MKGAPLYGIGQYLSNFIKYDVRGFDPFSLNSILIYNNPKIKSLTYSLKNLIAKVLDDNKYDSVYLVPMSQHSNGLSQISIEGIDGLISKHTQNSPSLKQNPGFKLVDYAWRSPYNNQPSKPHKAFSIPEGQLEKTDLRLILYLLLMGYSISIIPGNHIDGIEQIQDSQIRTINLFGGVFTAEEIYRTKDTAMPIPSDLTDINGFDSEINSLEESVDSFVMEPLSVGLHKWNLDKSYQHFIEFLKFFEHFINSVE
ncbi:MAG: hypothetical protein EU548_09345 [Promethearchaeota archaeon]|nr:MAG: hypothetical protein EU548_09345 [Candidatus Lokiarchaeota archaeon]